MSESSGQRDDGVKPDQGGEELLPALGSASELGGTSQVPASPPLPLAERAGKQPTHEPGKKKKKRPGSVFRKFRRTVRWTVALGIVAAIGLIVASRGPVPRYAVEREVRKYLEGGAAGQSGGKFSLDKVTVQLDGRVVAEGMKLEGLGEDSGTGAVPKSAGFTVASVRSVVVDLDWSAWAAGVVVPKEVTLHEPRLMLSVRPDGQLDLAGLKVPASTGTSTSGVKSVPRIELRDGTLMLGETTGADGPTMLNELKFSGWLSPIGNSSRYLMHGRLTRAGEGEGNAGSAGSAGGGGGVARRALQIDVTGEIDFESGSALIDISELAFSDIRPEELPGLVREVWRELAMRGRMSGAQLRVTRAGGVEATVELENVSLTVPIASGRADIVGSRKPRMDNVNGFVRFSGGSAAAEGMAGSGSGTSKGGLEASLSGSFEDLPAQLLLQSEGLSTDAAYHAVIIANDFNLEQDPRLLWFTPEIVQTNFERFSGPTARIDARIELDRARPESPGVAGETSIRGALSFSGGRAAFDKFPYPISELSGTVRFDDDRVDLVGIQGRGPSGALMFAEGVFDPPTADSRINLTVSVANLPMDSHLIEALNKSRGKALVDAIFSQERLDELVAKGLVSKGVGEAGGSPGFALDGTIDALTVKVQSPFGFTSPTSQLIDVRFDDVGILTKFFPYPIRGKNVLVRVGDDFAAVAGREFSGVSGGTAELDAFVKILRDPKTGEWGFEPALAMKTRGFPIDELLIHALPEPGQGELGKGEAGTGEGEKAAGAVAVKEDSKQEALNAKDVLRKLGIRGPVDADVTLLPGKEGGVDGGKSQLLADLLMQGLTARPEHVAVLSSSEVRGVPEPAVIRNLTGAIRISNESITINTLEGLIERRDAENREQPELPAFFRMEGRWPLADGIGPAQAAGAEAENQAVARRGNAPGVELLVENLDVRLALEDLIRPIEPAVAEKVIATRRTWDLSGRVDAEVKLEAKEDSALSDLTTSVTVRNAQAASVRVDDRYVQLVGLSGQVTASMEMASPLKKEAKTAEASAGDAGGTGIVIAIKDAESELRIDDERLGRLMADGVVRVLENKAGEAERGLSDRLVVEEPLRVRLRDVVLDSPLVLEGVERFAPKGVQEMMAELELAGLIDAEVRLAERQTRRLGEGAAIGERFIDKKEVRAAVRPVWLAGTWQGRRLEIESISGEVSFDGQRGAVSELRLLGQSFEARADGTYELLAGGGIKLAAQGAFEGAGLNDEVLRFVPDEVRAAIDEAKLKIERALVVEDLKAEFERDGGEGGGGEAGRSLLKASGRVVAAGVSAETGAAWRSPEVQLEVDVERALTGAWRAGASVVTPRVIVNDLAFANVEVEGEARGGAAREDNAHGNGGGGVEVTIDRLLATSYGGQIEMQGTLKRVGQQEVYEAGVRFDGVRLADLLIALAERKDAFTGPLPDDGFVRAFEILPDTTRGMLSGMASVRGVKGEDASRIGRGMVRVAGGQAIVNIPLVVPLLQISNLQIPSGESLDYAYGQVSMRGQELRIDQAAVLSESLALLGTGTVDLRDQGIDMRLRSLSRRRVPILSDVFEGLRDQLFTAHVVGTVKAPEFEIESLLSIRRALAGSDDPFAGTLEIDVGKLERDRERTLRGGGVAGGVVAEVAK